MHRDGHQDLRLHPCDVRPVLARRQEQGGGVRRGRRHGGDGGAAGQLHDQDNPSEKGRGGAQGDPVPLHGVALSLQPLQQRPAGVQAQGAASDEPAPGDPGRPGDSPLQVRSKFRIM